MTFYLPVTDKRLADCFEALCGGAMCRIGGLSTAWKFLRYRVKGVLQMDYDQIYDVLKKYARKNIENP